MAPVIATLDANSSRSTRHSAQPSNSRMPHVFVIPPEEEQQDNPPWCCFDADEQPGNTSDFASHHDILFSDIPYFSQQSENDSPIPITRRTAARQPRPTVPLPKKLEKKQRPETIKIIENTPSRARQKDVREDSDIIEVVKVKRTRVFTDPEENTNVKRSKTLKARASKALLSIKNVGKSSHRTHVKELWSSTESIPWVSKGVQEQIRSDQNQGENRLPTTPTKKRSLSRASTLSLAQLFQSVKPSRSETSIVRAPSSALLAETHRATQADPSSPPTHKYDNANVSLNSSKKNTLTKFSVRELHRLFSFSSSVDDPSLASSTSIPSPTSNLTSSDPDIPTEEGIFADALDLGNMDQTLTPPQRRREFYARRICDPDFEMKLDSLHFDTLSFDLEDFDDVLMEGNILP
ncbi:hypothetical protein JVU11DRAFT_471 [Chiua virens]|nr:hypothetical protein JVU11DRAFT_471 [Chiua virens]